MSLFFPDHPASLSPENEALPPAGIEAALAAFSARLTAAGVDSPRLSAEILLAKAVGTSRSDLLKRLILTPHSPLSPRQREDAEHFISRRAAGEPAAYILGEKEFYGRPFAVCPAVLIPRPETELLVDLALHANRDRKEPRGCFADFGAGSGCIAVTLALELPGWRGLALDIRPEALAVARTNAHRLGARLLSFALADFTAAPLAAGSLDLLVSNPPYISEEEYTRLSHEVRDYEPHSALVPPACAQNASGLEHALAVIAQSAVLLTPGGRLFMEIGAAQATPLLAALTGDAWAYARVHKDLAGLDRVVEACKRPVRQR